MAGIGIPTPAGIRRAIESATQRGVARPLELYVRHVARRGRILLPEVLGFRVAAEAYLARPDFRADPATLLERVRTPYAGGQVRGEWVERGPSTRTETVLLYVHGGAFIAFSPRTHRGLTSELAARSNRSVFSVDYRLAPEHRFPTGADDVLRAYSWLLSTGVRADRIVVAGDSAGGHLALGLTPRAARAGLPAPGAVVALSPVVDPSMGWARETELARFPDRQPLSSEAGIAALGAYTHGTSPSHRELMLVEDDLSVLPPVLLQASEDEMLIEDSRRYLAALREAGGQGELQTWPRKPHVFQVGFRLSSSASEALDKVAAFVVAHAGAAAENV